ncbi:ABC transporter permease [Methanosarcina mazei]|jgi:osmoprotectant transport system permease protein|uniref:ABC transporter permease n=7 Tax=Methanosarcina mazei TaxID=2209 RepID=A0A0F8FM49_METMZ|nr:ABC transporter permease [Methanosarcina mazei]AAM29991.1 Glycine betaine transport system, permease protein [Methanosarcina mazei Go1]AGF95747.1 ABC proline/glycine betaine transporter, inner membrane subunit [Methanosarcina mazei Tuc01]AKB39984.1 Osmotically activated L-carnitine/choline ABC transporter, permease protein OpuCB [Methanosarcina mazei WWM610]AKB60945.1 Osmotically activated L-carnitine/choline ABC transporter, permease protein OpuCB [Methanosarcina mazei SarPi]AKB67548.1 Osm
MVITAEILEATLEHLFLAYTALLVGALVSVPLIFLSLYNAKLASLVMRFSNLVQAVPSFAVVAVVVPLIGIGFFPAVIAIMLRVLLPIVKNTYIGLFNVDPALLDSAKGIGMTDFQVLRYVRLPNAYPAIFAGIKFAAILANSIAVLTALIGGGGLGSMIFEGLTNFNTSKILAGTLPVILIALFLDFFFSALEKRLTPEYLKKSG